MSSYKSTKHLTLPLRTHISQVNRCFLVGTCQKRILLSLLENIDHNNLACERCPKEIEVNLKNLQHATTFLEENTDLTFEESFILLGFGRIAMFYQCMCIELSNTKLETLVRKARFSRNDQDVKI